MSLKKLEEWFESHLASEKVVPEVQEELRSWFESRKVRIADTLRKVRREVLKERDDSLVILEDIFEAVVMCKLIEVERKDVNLEELQHSLLTTSRGLLALWRLGVIHRYQGLPEDHSLSWPKVAEYLARLGHSIPAQSPKGPGRPREGIKDLLPYMVWTTIRIRTERDHYKYVFKIVRAAGYRRVEPNSLEIKIRDIDKRLTSKTGQNPS